MVFRSHNPEKFGDSVASQVNVAAAMKGETLAAVARGNGGALSPPPPGQELRCILTVGLWELSPRESVWTPPRLMTHHKAATAAVR